MKKAFFGLMILVLAGSLLYGVASGTANDQQPQPAITKTRQFFFLVNCNDNFTVVGPFKDAKDCEAIRIWTDKKARAGCFYKDVSPAWYIDKY